MKKVKVYMAALVAALLVFSCAATIEVQPGGMGAVIAAPMFEACEGVTFNLTTRQNGKPTLDMSGTISDGKLEFSSRALREYDFTQTVSLEMRVTSRPELPCPLAYMELYYTENPVVLTPQGDDRYSVSGDKFKKM